MPQKKIVKKFNYPIEIIEDLILSIDDYKDFLPWCTNSKIKSKNDKYVNLINTTHQKHSILSTLFKKLILDKSSKIHNYEYLLGFDSFKFQTNLIFLDFKPSSINHLKESFCIINKSGISRTFGIFANESLEF